MRIKAKAMTIRLPQALYKAGREMAKRRRMSLNRLVQESLQATIRTEEEQRLYDAFTLVGQDTAESSVEFAIAAQLEVLERDDD
jgi:hypothetical protein